MQAESAKKETDPNPPYGARGDFRKITITLPLDAYEKLMEESARRKLAGAPNQLLSALVREAASCYFDDGDLKHMDDPTKWTSD
ncbi:MAG TPA: hypothetical protein VLY24_02475 [Bryobacteraceae bacterium]|nr:hypothetical protein [Bryobacteraceae bacterium]